MGVLDFAGEDGAAGFAVRSTAGAAAGCEFALAAGWAAGAADGTEWLAAARVVTERLVTGAGLAVAVRVERTTVRVFTVVAFGAAVSLGAGAATLVSVETGGGSTLTGCVVAVTGAGSVGCACWANKGVEESARAAAIAGRALVRA